MVSAWANKNNLVLGQVRVSNKPNGVTAIPDLLDKLILQGNIITIDAMGTQTDIDEKIIENDANYILVVKENQKQLLEEGEGSDSLKMWRSYRYRYGTLTDKDREM
jgi:predicted transposase YbfD/YdcC